MAKDTKTKKQETEKSKTTKKFLSKKNSLILLVVAIVFGVLILSFSWYSIVYAQKIYPNIFVGNTDFGGLTTDEATKLLAEKVDTLNNTKIQLIEGDNKWDLNIKDLNLQYDNAKTANSLYAYGRDGSFWQNLRKKIGLIFVAKHFNSSYEYNTEELYSFFDDVFNSVGTPVKNASYIYNDGELTITDEQAGQEINSDDLVAQLDKSISTITPPPDLTLTVVDVEPKITKAQLEDLKPEVTNIISSEIKLESDRKNITISQEQIFDWIDIVADEKDKTKVSVNQNKVYAADNDNTYAPTIEINQDKVKQYVEGIAKDINQEPQDAKLTYSSGKVSVSQTPQKGYTLDQDATVKQITTLLTNRETTNKTASNNNTIKLTLKVTEPAVSDTNIENLGIKEQISSATTNFVGSSDNRIANIKKGASMFNGLLIKPGDTLSAISVIGNPSAETGYVSELVIKEGKTTSEYGGGLCQVSTTLFRASLNAGLEIVERTNHAYRVSYYEPPVGMDATVYYPNPDLVIKNNTDHYILIQTKVEGTSITFDLYGTKDSREISISDPKITEVTDAPADKYVESSDLAAGVVKKTESSHQGAKTEFNYKVTKDGKTMIEETFYSVYKAWQAVYLYGPGTQNSPGKDYKDAGGNKCSNECEEGWTECKDGGIRRCNKDGDCYKWSAVESCGDGKTCSNNQCLAS